MGVVGSSKESMDFSDTDDYSPRRKFRDNYIISGDPIGIGSFASVHRCFRKSDLSEFAVKMINKNYLTAKELSGLKNEIKILRNTSHKNIIKLIDVFNDKRNVYMVLELCRGQDLFDQIVASKATQLTESKAASIIYTLSSALQYLHSEGIVHRDIKPENILFGIDGTLKITDFGLASSPSVGSRSNDNVLMSTCCGTPHYVAPEIISGKEYDSKCDSWSLGVLLYIMLVGYQPFRADSLNQIYSKISIAKYDFKSKRWSKISKEAKHLVGCLMELDPKKRYSTQEIRHHSWIVQNVDIN